MKLNITKRLQEIELNLLKEFLLICKKENLHYYLLGGTLLGAVRHKGFIPWDDDVDIGMPRKDYEKFISCAQKYLPEYCFLQTFRTDPQYPFPFAKIRDNRTIYKEFLLSKLQINHGVWIDIFPLDFCSTNYKWLTFLQRILFKRTSCKFVFKKNFIQRMLQVLSCIICPSWKKSIEWHDKLLQAQESDATMMANFCGRYGRKEMVPSSWFKEPVYLEFEGLKVAAPTEYHKYLTHIYGNYMQLPPEEKRVSLHPVAEIKFNLDKGENK